MRSRLRTTQTTTTGRRTKSLRTRSRAPAAQEQERERERLGLRLREQGNTTASANEDVNDKGRTNTPIKLARKALKDVRRKVLIYSPRIPIFSSAFVLAIVFFVAPFVDKTYHKMRSEGRVASDIGDLIMDLGRFQVQVKEKSRHESLFVLLLSRAACFSLFSLSSLLSLSIASSTFFAFKTFDSKLN